LQSDCLFVREEIPENGINDVSVLLGLMQKSASKLRVANYSFVEIMPENVGSTL